MTMFRTERRSAFATTLAAFLAATAGCGSGEPGKKPDPAGTKSSGVDQPVDQSVMDAGMSSTTVPNPKAPPTAVVEAPPPKPLVEQDIVDAVEGLSRRAAFLEELGSMESAKQVRQELVRALLLLHGRDHWRTRAAELAATNLETVLAGGPEAGLKYRKMRQLQEKFLRQQEQNNFANALELVDEGRKLAVELFGAESLDAAVWKGHGAAVSQAEGKHADAETALREAKALYEKLAFQERPEYADCLQMLAESCKALGKTDEAVQVADRAAEVRKTAPQ